MNLDLKQIIEDNFTQSIQTKQKSIEVLTQPLSQSINLLVECFKSNHKMLICGNGGSAADSQHFAAEFTGRYEDTNRRALPAIALTTDTSALTAIGNDYSYDVIFAKQVEALGQAKDILFAISTSGNSKNVIEAIKVAHHKRMHVIALTGGSGGEIAHLLNYTQGDIQICVPATRTARVQEVHLVCLHTICNAIDLSFKD